MSVLESIAKLREWSHRYDNGWIQKDGSIVITTDTHGVYYGENYGESIRAMIDEIEAEIAEKYIELPADEEGAVLHIGDELKCQGESILLNSLSWDGRRWYATETVVSSGWYPVHLCRHVKPRTIEDVLRDVWKEALDYANSAIWRNPDEVFAERADEIRELTEVER